MKNGSSAEISFPAVHTPPQIKGVFRELHACQALNDGSIKQSSLVIATEEVNEQDWRGDNEKETEMVRRMVLRRWKQVVGPIMQWTKWWDWTRADQCRVLMSIHSNLSSWEYCRASHKRVVSVPGAIFAEIMRSPKPEAFNCAERKMSSMECKFGARVFFLSSKLRWHSRQNCADLLGVTQTPSRPFVNFKMMITEGATVHLSYDWYQGYDTERWTPIKKVCHPEHLIRVLNERSQCQPSVHGCASEQ